MSRYNACGDCVNNCSGYCVLTMERIDYSKDTSNCKKYDSKNNDEERV